MYNVKCDVAIIGGGPAGLAAAIAAKFSKAQGTNISVDYTEVRNIKKPGGSKPGFVTYKTNYTAVVDPMSDEEIEAHRVKN